MAQPSTKRTTEGPVIPDRLYFKIGDVARICGIETYVLRFWETQFSQLKPNKSGTGQRLYRKRDVELVLEIQRLLHKEGYTIAGAKQALESAPGRRGAAKAAEAAAERRPASARGDAGSLRAGAALNQVRAELREISLLLENPQPAGRRERAKVIKVRPDSESLFPL